MDTNFYDFLKNFGRHYDSADDKTKIEIISRIFPVVFPDTGRIPGIGPMEVPLEPDPDPTITFPEPGRVPEKKPSYVSPEPNDAIFNSALYQRQKKVFVVGQEEQGSSVTLKCPCCSTKLMLRLNCITE